MTATVALPDDHVHALLYYGELFKVYLIDYLKMIISNGFTPSQVVGYSCLGGTRAGSTSF